jgi:RNA polymerase sigma-70 factor (ECF subfamily)
MAESSKNSTSQTWVTTTLILEGLANSENSQAWSGFVGYFKPILVGFARKSGLNQQAAEDFAQQALLEFFKSYRTGRYDREKGRLSHWLFGIARKVLSQTFRRSKPEKVATDLQRSTSDSQPLENFADPSAAEDLWQQQWEKMVMQICMDRARKEFDEKTFAAFEMYALQDLEPTEVAKRLGLSRNAVYIAKSRILSRLRELIEEFDR